MPFKNGARGPSHHNGMAFAAPLNCQVATRLRDGEPLPFDELFAKGDPRGKLIATFLALLELIRSGEARAFQEAVIGKIVVFPVEMLEQPQ